MTTLTPSHIAQASPTRAELLLDRLRSNVRVLSRLAAPAGLLAVVKANAYGHGATRITRVLETEGVRDFAVARLDEALRLRSEGCEANILVIGAPLIEHIPLYRRHHIGLTVSSVAVAEAVRQPAPGEGRLDVHVKIDTGMRRIGVAPNEAADVIHRLTAAPGVRVASVWTHFASAGAHDTTFALEQIAHFDAVQAAIGPNNLPLHIGNTAAVLRLRDRLCTTDRERIRVGGALYGVSHEPARLNDAGLLPVMRLVSRVVHVKTVPAGDSVSYGRTWFATAPTRIATVATGYADGYPRALSNRGFARIGEQLYRIAGTVCMDMTMLDLGAPDGPGAAVAAGDDVVLFGPEGPSIYDVAAWSDRTPYEILCGISPRVPRFDR
ncbi:MAG: alanine racemase [Rhodothermales bacterium]|nr:alanine racemase [Rhodothermales bacterium]